MMLQPRTVPLWVLLCCFLTIAFLYHHSKTISLSSYSSELFTHPSSSKPSNILNSTLGFEKVLAIGLKERSDKRDALALISSLSGFKVDWIEGSRGESVPDKALPFGVDRVALWENNLGSWRGHMDAIRTVVENGWSSALIMEDDMDWDVRIKDQLLQAASGARYIFPSPITEQRAPYGDDWDILWLGHCGEVFPETLDEYKSLPATSPSLLHIARKYTYLDASVPPPAFARGFQNFTASPRTRWVHMSGGPICSFAYAVSARGARKILFDLSVDHLVGPFDNALSGLCRWGREEERLGMRCVSVTPPLFMHHKAKGRVSGDSDIQRYGGDGEIREKGYSENLMWSARNNIRNSLMESPMESQFPED